MQKKDNSKPSMRKNERKRGRPAGKNRVPLSLDERRARNAQYERERRNETADAMAQLVEAARCDPQITNPDLLATVINRFQNVQADKSLDDLRRINEDLESQIAALEKRLAEDSSEEGADVEKKSKKRTIPLTGSDTDRNMERRRPAKLRKSSKKSKVHEVPKQSQISDHESSTDSQDWSNHHLGKSLPPAMEHFIVQRSPSPFLQENESKITDVVYPVSDLKTSSKTLSTIKLEDSSSDDGAYSESSKDLESFYDNSHQNVEMEFQFLHPLPQIKPENKTEEQSKDPFTDQEKAILSHFGWGDYDFEGGYSENQARWSHMDFAH